MNPIVGFKAVIAINITITNLENPPLPKGCAYVSIPTTVAGYRGDELVKQVIQQIHWGHIYGQKWCGDYVHHADDQALADFFYKHVEAALKSRISSRAIYGASIVPDNVIYISFVVE